MDAALDGDPTRAAQLQTHVAACGRCRGQWEALQAAEAALRVPRPVQAPDGMLLEFRQRLAGQETTAAKRRLPWRWHWIWPIGSLAAAGTAAAVVFAFRLTPGAPGLARTPRTEMMARGDQNPARFTAPDALREAARSKSGGNGPLVTVPPTPGAAAPGPGPAVGTSPAPVPPVSPAAPVPNSAGAPPIPGAGHPGEAVAATAPGGPQKPEGSRKVELAKRPEVEGVAPEGPQPKLGRNPAGGREVPGSFRNMPATGAKREETLAAGAAPVSAAADFEVSPAILTALRRPVTVHQVTATLGIAAERLAEAADVPVFVDPQVARLPVTVNDGTVPLWQALQSVAEQGNLQIYPAENRLLIVPSGARVAEDRAMVRARDNAAAQVRRSTAAPAGPAAGAPAPPAPMGQADRSVKKPGPSAAYGGVSRGSRGPGGPAGGTGGFGGGGVASETPLEAGKGQYFLAPDRDVWPAAWGTLPERGFVPRSRDELPPQLQDRSPEALRYYQGPPPVTTEADQQRRLQNQQQSPRYRLAPGRDGAAGAREKLEQAEPDSKNKPPRKSRR